MHRGTAQAGSTLQPHLVGIFLSDNYPFQNQPLPRESLCTSLKVWVFFLFVLKIDLVLSGRSYGIQKWHSLLYDERKPRLTR